MSSELTPFEQMKLALYKTGKSLAIEPTNSKEWLSWVDNYNTLFALEDNFFMEWLSWVDDYSSMLHASYPMPCEECGSKEHFNYQCKYNNDPILASYNTSKKCTASITDIELVLFKGTFELLLRISYIKVLRKALEMIYSAVHPIFSFCKRNFGENPHIKDRFGWTYTAIEETKLLQDTRRNYEKYVHH